MGGPAARLDDGSAVSQSLWKWLALVIVLVTGGLASYAVYRLGRRWDGTFRPSEGRWNIGTLVLAIGLVVIPFMQDYLLSSVVGVRFELLAILSKLLLTLSFGAGVYAAFVLSGFLADLFIYSRNLQERSVNAHFVRVSARILGIVASVLVVVAAAEYLGVALTPLLAGLGIGGLAVALAARPTLENVIGGFTLFADKPVRVGDYCQFGSEEGTVEEIGLRSTRIRKLDDTVVSIPNADFSQMQLQNNARRRSRLHRATLGLRYETTPEQLRFVIAEMREMLVAHPKVLPDQLFVRFAGFGAYSLDVEVFARLNTVDWLQFRAIREDINLRIMDIVKEAGTSFAFPSQTAYLARDSGLDIERGAEAEAQVQFWRAKGKLPFPEFEEEERERLENTLDYPPRGSPDYVNERKGSD